MYLAISETSTAWLDNLAGKGIYAMPSDLSLICGTHIEERRTGFCKFSTCTHPENQKKYKRKNHYSFQCVCSYSAFPKCNLYTCLVLESTVALFTCDGITCYAVTLPYCAPGGDATDSMDNALSHTLNAQHVPSLTHIHAFTISNLKTRNVYLFHVP